MSKKEVLFTAVAFSLAGCNSAPPPPPPFVVVRSIVSTFSERVDVVKVREECFLRAVESRSVTWAPCSCDTGK